jgi:hypothetical protein
VRKPGWQRGGPRLDIIPIIGIINFPLASLSLCEAFL